MIVIAEVHLHSPTSETRRNTHIPSSPATPINPFATPRKSLVPPTISPSPFRTSSAVRSLSFAAPSLLRSPASAPQPSRSSVAVSAVVLRSTASADVDRDALSCPTAALIPSSNAAPTSFIQRRPAPPPSTPSTAPSRLQQLRRRAASRSSRPSLALPPSSLSSRSSSRSRSPSRRKLDWWSSPRHHSPAAVKRAKQYGGLHHSTGIVSSAADELRGEKRQQVERDMHAWQQRINHIHHRQQQQQTDGEPLVLDRPAGKRQKVEEGGPAIKRSLFAAGLSGRDGVSEEKVHSEGNSGDEEVAEDDISGVELLQDSGMGKVEGAQEEKDEEAQRSRNEATREASSEG